MTTLQGREGSALLVIDVQNGVIGGAHRKDEVVATIRGLVDRARAEGTPVVWIQHSDDELARGSDEWRIVDELSPAAGEPVVHKHYADAFEESSLEEVLEGGRVGRIVVAGSQTDECIRSTLHGGLVRGYDVTLVGDAHTTEDLSDWGAPTPDLVIAHTNLYWSNHRAPGRTAEVADAAEVVLG
ncbi:isochorismatase family protein [Leifsonia sp. F6_8S_P_1B]|uniref:Isochorismatase family protein n=1 Tax=Leifsonia williamsii TaxID=3035919 RepID=A0ABT8KBV2_9MICO|nr:isochorismatase family protein [Leifsonia williamsii]MDN4614935.1 isochorismatase family protein [Leifsonia williamsii]